MEEQRKKEAAATIVGFGLAKAATSLGYLSAMGSVGQSVGFVTELWFMFASEAASIIVASLVIALACRGAVKPGSFAMWPGVAALVAGFAASAVFAQAGVALEMAPLLGVLYGIGQTVVSIAWLDIFSMQESERSHICMVCGLVLQAFIVAGSFCFGYGLAFDLIVCAMAACSLVCYRVSVALAHEPARASALEDHGAGNAAQSLGEAAGGARTVARSSGETMPVRRILLTFGPDYWCLFALVGVVGILHTSVLGSSSEHIVGDVSMAAPLFASTAVASAIALVASRRGNPAAAYKACLPVMLVVLSLMPFIGDALGPISGTIMIMCYDVCGMLFLFYIANASRETGVSSFALSGIYLIGSNAFLAFGLAAGLVVGAFSASRGVSLLTLLAFVALYPLGIAFVFAMRHSEREIAGGGASVLGAESTEGGCVFGDASEGDGGASEGDGAEGSVASGDVRANVRLGGNEAIGDTTAGVLWKSAASAGAALPHVLSSSDTTAQGHQIENALMADGQLNVGQLSSAEGHAAQKEAGIGAAAESAAEPDWRGELASFAQIYGLTPRETEICSYLVRGRSAKHIAEELVISENTVWSHVKNVYAKTGAAGKNALIELFEKSAMGE